MRKAFRWATFLLAAVFVICLSAKAQNAPAGQTPAQGNQPGNPPQQGMRRGPAPPVQGPAHDPHDLTGIWNARRGYGGDTYTGPAAEFTSWGQEQFKKAKASNGG